MRKPSGIWATDKGFRTLYPIGADGGPDTSQPGVVAPLGIALYVAGAGVAVALVGSLMLRFSGQAGGADAIGGGASVGAQTKKCPDCAETILADAKVCKHCEYRFVPREEARASRETRPFVRHEAKAFRGTVRRVAISFDVGEHGARPDDSRGRSWIVWRFGVQGADTWREVARDQDVPSGGYVFWAACSIVLLISAAVLVAVFIGLLTT